MSKHTPGPWSHRNGRVFQTDRDVLTIANVARAADGGYCPANGDLIAAAPELLEFIQYAADQLESGIQEYTESPEDPPQPASKWDYDAGQLVGELRRLIAKARGEA